MLNYLGWLCRYAAIIYVADLNLTNGKLKNFNFALEMKSEKEGSRIGLRFQRSASKEKG